MLNLANNNLDGTIDPAISSFMNLSYTRGSLPASTAAAFGSWK